MFRGFTIRIWYHNLLTSIRSEQQHYPYKCWLFSDDENAHDDHGDDGRALEQFEQLEPLQEKG